MGVPVGEPHYASSCRPLLIASVLDQTTSDPTSPPLNRRYVDLGAYGVPQNVRDKKPWDFEKSLLHMESWTRERGGYQCFYTDFLLTRDEYKEMFDHTLYDKVIAAAGAWACCGQVEGSGSA